MAFITIIIFPLDTLRRNASFWFWHKRDSIYSHKGRCLSPRTHRHYILLLGWSEKTLTEENFPKLSWGRIGEWGWFLPLTHFSQIIRGGVAHPPAVLSLPEYNSSWHFHFVTWGILFFLVPGIICGSIYKRKALVISPIWVPGAAMPEKQFGKVSRGQSPKWL